MSKQAKDSSAGDSIQISVQGDVNVNIYHQGDRSQIKGGKTKAWWQQLLKWVNPF